MASAMPSALPKKLTRQLSALTLHSNVVDLSYDRDRDNEVTQATGSNFIKPLRSEFTSLES